MTHSENSDFWQRLSADPRANAIDSDLIDGIVRLTAYLSKRRGTLPACNLICWKHTSQEIQDRLNSIDCFTAEIRDLLSDLESGR